MDASFHPAVFPLIRKLESIVSLDESERATLLNLPLQVTTLRADQDIVREGDRPTRSCALLEGFACTFKVTAEGKRQITAFHIPGDIPDLQSLHLEVLDSSLGTLTPAEWALSSTRPCRPCATAIPGSRARCGARP